MGWEEGKKQSHSHSKVSEDTKSLEKPILQHLCPAAGMAGPPQGLEARGWEGSGGLKVSAQQESLVAVQVLVTGYMQHALAKTTEALGTLSLVET